MIKVTNMRSDRWSASLREDNSKAGNQGGGPPSKTNYSSLMIDFIQKVILRILFEDYKSNNS